MTTVEIVFRYAGEPSEAEVFALANAREVYGIRRLSFDRAASTLLVEYDATRLNAAVVTQLVRRSGLQLIEELPPPEPVALPAPVVTGATVDTKPAAAATPSPQTVPPPGTSGPVPPPAVGSAPSPAPLP